MGEKNIVRLLPVKTRTTPNRCRYMAHFAYLGTTCAKCHGPFLWYISLHHYSNSDPSSDLTYNSITPALWSSGYCPSIWQYHYHTHYES